MLRIKLLGGFELDDQRRYDTGRNSLKIQSLLACLSLNAGNAMPRLELATRLWPEANELQGRNSLRQLLHYLRQSLPQVAEQLETDTTQISWRDGAELAVDTTEFLQALAQAEADGEGQRETDRRRHLEDAIALYRGDLLPTCYDDWIQPERERLRHLYINAIRQLCETCEREGDLLHALEWARRLCDLDPLDESAALSAARLHVKLDDHPGASHCHQRIVAALSRELGVPLSAASEVAFKLLLAAPATRGSGHEEQTFSPQESDTPFVGREAERARLLEQWRLCMDGQARLVLVSGDAGIGKSRLAQEVMTWARNNGQLALHSRAYAAEGELSFGPIADLLKHPVVWADLAKLDVTWLREIARVIPELESVVVGAGQSWSDVNDTPPLAQRRRMFEALACAMLVLRRPLLLVIDDLQWCDPETLEWLHYLIRHEAAHQLLIIGTARPEAAENKSALQKLLADVRRSQQLETLGLKPLDAAECARLARAVSHREIAETEAMHIFKETEGNPLFVVEMARAGVESLTQDLADESVQLPPRIHAMIADRLSQVSTSATDVMQLAAIAGRAFDLDIVLRASNRSEEDVLTGLDELWRAGIIRERGLQTYDFTHDKLRDVALAQVGIARRRLLHRRVAQALETVHANDLDTVCAQLAAHYEQAGATNEAIIWHEHTARVAQQRFAYTVCMRHIKSALALLRGRPLQSGDNERELTLISMTSTLPIDSYGLQVDEQLKFALRARELETKLGKPKNPSNLRALAIDYILKADFSQSLAIGVELLAYGSEQGDPVVTVQGHYLVGVSCSPMGQFSKSRYHLSQAIDLYQPEHAARHIAAFGWDPKVVCLCRQAQNLWCMGFPEQAVRAQEASLEYAHALAHPFSLAYAQIYDSFLRYLLGDIENLRRATDSVFDTCARHDIAFWMPRAAIMDGWLMANAGDVGAGIERMKSGRAGVTAQRVRVLQGIVATQFAEQLARSGDVDAAIEELNDALAELDANSPGERWYEAELHRFLGDVLLTRDEGAAAAQYASAYDVALAQSAYMPALRTATRYSRLLANQGRQDQALALLQPVLDWFTEGEDMPDLREARQLLTKIEGLNA